VVEVERDDREAWAVARRARRLDRKALLEAAAVEQAGERVDARLGLEVADEALVAGREAPHDRADDRDRDDDVNPAVEVADPGRHRGQRDAVRHADARDDRDRPAPPVERGGPQDRPHVHHRRVGLALRRGEGERDQHRAERTERKQGAAREPRPEERRERRDGERGEAGQERELRPTGDRRLHEALDDRAGVDQRGAARDRSILPCQGHTFSVIGRNVARLTVAP